MRNPKGVIAYLLLAFGIAWITWQVPIQLGVPASSPLFQLYILPGAFSPAIAALLVRVFGKEGFADAGLKLNFRHWPYFVFALLLPVAVVGAILLQVEASGLGHADFTLATAIKALAGRALPANTPAYVGLLIIPQLLFTAILTTPVLWGEEFGWRGYLQPRLFPGKPLLAALATGPIWAVWHYPLIFRGYDFGDQALPGAAVMLVSCTLVSYIFAWLVERTGSIWSSSLAHAATNGVGGSLTLLWFAGLKQPLLTSYIGVFGLAPLLLVCIAIHLLGRRTGSASVAPGRAADIDVTE